MATYIDASEMASINPNDTIHDDYPTPDHSCKASSPPADSEPLKKKRKAWGQPVPPINPILPPRKRAKTAEEKEQRKNERILRNRRAADKSRQRQKAAVADLERRQIEIEAENAQLKEMLSQYQSQFGTIPGCEFKPQVTTPRSSSILHDDDQSIHPDEVMSTPTLTSNTSAGSVYPGSPILVPTLSLGESALFSSSNNDSGMTQYPAVSTGEVSFEASIPDSEQSIVRGLDLDPLSSNMDVLFGENALDNVVGFPSFGENPLYDFEPTGISHPDQFSFDSYLDFDAGNHDATSGFPFETSEQTARLQS